MARRRSAARRASTASTSPTPWRPGTKTAYGAVAKPVEGTILTVIREASAAAVAAAERDNDIESVLAATVDAAEKVRREDARRSCRSCARPASSTPAGRACSGCSRARSTPPGDGPPGGRGGPRRAPSPITDRYPLGAETDEELRLRDDVPAPARGRVTRSTSTRSGDTSRRSATPCSSPATREAQGPRPQRAAGRGHRRTACRSGPCRRISVENLDNQARDVREAKAAAFIEEGGTVHGGLSATAVAHAGGGTTSRRRRTTGTWPASRLPLGIVAVVPSDGLAALFDELAAGYKEFVAIRIVRGGQTREPVHRRAARRRRGHAGRRAAHPAQQPQRDPRRAPGRLDVRPADPHRADAQRAEGFAVAPRRSTRPTRSRRT